MLIYIYIAPNYKKEPKHDYINGFGLWISWVSIGGVARVWYFREIY
jgi:hypothetical protein